jgi:chaperonin cofactor prefoldin
MIHIPEPFSLVSLFSHHQALQKKIDSLKAEEEDIVKRQDVLKKGLYARFGDSINLEN